MSEYEIMLLTSTEIDDQARTAIVERAKEAATTHGGTWGEVADWGRKKTSYPIEKQDEAHYQVLNVDGTGETLDEAVRVLRITDGVLRVMATNRVPAYPEGAKEGLERISDEEFAAGPKDRGRGGRGGRGGGRGRDRD
ncbi:MAG: ribosomal protein [Thermoleophilia bacterium]|nr:ribosomal protein [Thermoleophilia bacterium]MCZ4496287.1 ribosomal protein [Thermoleophilia bacterium]